MNQESIEKIVPKHEETSAQEHLAHEAVEHVGVEGGVSLEKAQGDSDVMNPVEITKKNEHEKKVEEVKKSLFAKFKEKIFGSNESGNIDLNTVTEDIKSLNIKVNFDAGLGGLGNFGTSALAGYEKMISKYNLGEKGNEVLGELRSLADTLSKMPNSQEKVEKTMQFNNKRFEFFNLMKQQVEITE